MVIRQLEVECITAFQASSPIVSYFLGVNVLASSGLVDIFTLTPNIWSVKPGVT